MPTPVIIDTDPGVDDAVALLYALASPEIEILGIIVSFGNTDINASYDNILKLYNTLAQHFDKFPDDRKRFPNSDSRPFLARGAHGPLEGALQNAEFFHGRDGLGDITNRYPDISTGNGSDYLQLSDRLGHELALDLIHARPPRTVTYIALGPLTNLALMVRRDPTTCRNTLGRVVSMGGALDVPGNSNPVAEFNFFADPYAVKELLVDAAIPLSRFLLLPLDITTPHELSFPLYANRVDPTFKIFGPPSRAEEKSPITHFTSAFFERTREVMREYGKDSMELHDVVAVWCAILNPPQAEEDEDGLPILQDRWKAQRRLFQIERTGELTRGMLVVDRRDEAAEAPTEQEKRFQTGENKAEVQAPLDRAVHDLPAPVQVELGAPEHVHPKGVACIVETPGSETLVASMLSRIWGITA
ncbi:nucleoside hydrolase [Phellopilus nigrolimitatus]|nr:nucleoside hydrolase [Phellopilus nigrolimitatus]